MTKVSMRHLNEIVRERNQYSRDALEAWQDFINLKGRMDTELAKVTKRNNYLVEELEGWKQQVRSRILDYVGLHDTNVHPSSSNSKRSLRHSPRRLKTSRSRLRTTSVRTAVSEASLTSRRMTTLVYLFVLLVPRSSVMMLWKRSSCNRRSPRSSSANARGIRRSFPLCSTPT